MFYTHETGNVTQHIYPFNYFTGAMLASPFGIPIGDTSQPSTYDEYAVYGSATWHLTNRFDVETGLRYSHDRQRYDLTQSGRRVRPTRSPNSPVDKSDSSTTFSVTPRYHISDTTLVYARAASGFLPGGPKSRSLPTCRACHRPSARPS